MRSLLMRRLAVRLLKIPFFSALSLDELKNLVQSAMYKQRYSAGDVIMSGDTRDNGIYFILSGLVQVELISAEPKEGSGSKDFVSRTISGETGTLLRTQTEGNLEAARSLEKWDLGTNQIFGEMCLLVGSNVQTRAIAKERTKVLVLPGQEVARLISEHAAVRDQVSLRAVERLRQVKELRHMPETTLASLATKSTYKVYQAGEVVFSGVVDKMTPILCLVLGSVEVLNKKTQKRRIFNAACLMCTEHLDNWADSDAFKALALETTTVLTLDRHDIDNAIVASSPSSIGGAFELPPMPQIEVNSVEILPGSIQASKADLRIVDLEAADTTDGSLKDHLREQRVQETAMPQTPPPEDVREISLTLGWAEDETEVSEDDNPVLERLDSALLEQVTDVDLADNEQDFFAQVSEQAAADPVRSSSKSSGRISLGGIGSPGTQRRRSSSRAKPYAMSVNQDAQNIDDPEKQLSPTSNAHQAKENSASHRAIMVWLGILIDAVPESLVIGILINKSAVGGEEEDRSARAAAAAMPFVIGVFLSNLPEAMSSSGSMKDHGIRVSTIMLMWGTTTVLTAIGAALGSVLFPPGQSDHASAMVVSSVEGLAAGAMLTMIAQTMMPEAFEQGGDVVGLSCLAGFLCALSVKLIPV